MRLLGITIPDNKQLGYGLTALYGIGHSRALEILKTAKIDPLLKAKDASAEDENTLRTLISEYALEGDLRREISQNIKRLKDIKTYKGVRHSRGGVPVRGQRSKTNSRTVKGNKRVTMGSGRRKVEKT